MSDNDVEGDDHVSEGEEDNSTLDDPVELPKKRRIRTTRGKAPVNIVKAIMDYTLNGHTLNGHL